MCWCSAGSSQLAGSYNCSGCYWVIFGVYGGDWGDLTGVGYWSDELIFHLSLYDFLCDFSVVMSFGSYCGDDLALCVCEPAYFRSDGDPVLIFLCLIGRLVCIGWLIGRLYQFALHLLSGF